MDDDTTRDTIRDTTDDATGDAAGVPGGTYSARLCFTPDGTRLAVGLDTGVLWLDTTSGDPAGHDHAGGRVHDLAAHPAAGVVAATARGLRRVTS